MTTSTQELTAVKDGNPPSPTNDTVEVEIWGPAGNGKSVLLVSLVETLLKTSDLLSHYMTPRLVTLHKNLLDGSATSASETQSVLDQSKQEGEFVAFDLPVPDGVRRFRVTSNAGEDLMTGTRGIDVPTFVKHRQGKVFVACLNPFKIDSEMAWKALNHLIVVFGPGRDLPTAFQLAVGNLLQIRPEDVAKRPKLMQMLSNWSDTKITYIPEETDPEKRFKWDRIDEGVKAELRREMRDLIDSVIRSQRLLVEIVRQALQNIENSVVVLTHVDLIDALLPSITFTDLERVYRFMFVKRPERMVSQQAVSRLFEIELDSPFGASSSSFGNGYSADGDPTTRPLSVAPMTASTGPAPTGATNEYAQARRGITRKLREDGAIQLVEYLRAVAKGGVEPAVIQANKLRQQLENMKHEFQAVHLKQLEVTNQLNGTKTALDAEKIARSRLEGDTAKLTADLGQKTRDLEKVLADAARSSTERQQLSTDLEMARRRIEELGAAEQEAHELQVKLDEQRRLHDSAAEDSRGFQLKIKDLSDQLLRNSTMGQDTDATVTKLRTDLSQALQDRDTLQSRIATLDNEVQARGPAIDRIRAERDGLKSQLAEAIAKLADHRPASPSVPSPGRDYQRAISERDQEIERQRMELQNQAQAMSQLKREVATAQGGIIPPDEARQRDAYERGRLGSIKLWSLFMLRAMPALPMLAGLIYLLLKGFLNGMGTSPSRGHIFAIASLMTIVITSLASLVSVGLQLIQLPSRWIWLRSMSMTTPRTLEALTSGGERLNKLSPGNFTLERSPLLSVLGIGMIRRNDSGQRYVTTEPGAWLAAPERPASRWMVMMDLLTGFLVAIWIAAIVFCFGLN